MAYPNSYQNSYATQYPNRNPQLLNLPQAQQIWKEYGQPAINYVAGQVAPKVGMIAGIGIPAGAIPYVFNNPQGRIAALATTAFAAPFINGARNIVNNPAVQRAGNYVSKIADWIF